MFFSKVGQESTFCLHDMSRNRTACNPTPNFIAWRGVNTRKNSLSLTVLNAMMEFGACVSLWEGATGFNVRFTTDARRPMDVCGSFFSNVSLFWSRALIHSSRTCPSRSKAIGLHLLNASFSQKKTIFMILLVSKIFKENLKPSWSCGKSFPRNLGLWFPPLGAEEGRPFEPEIQP